MDNFDDADYDEYNYYENYNDSNSWEIRIGNVSKEFETKLDAIEYLLDQIDTISDNQFISSIEQICNELVDDSIIYFEDLTIYLSNLSSTDFNLFIKKLCKTLKIKNNFKLINIDGDELEFGEL